MQSKMSNIKGFRNLDDSDGTIGKCLESQAIYDYQESQEPNLIALKVVGKSYSSEDVLRMVEKLPLGQKLWVFSPFARPKLKHNNMIVTHVPANSNSEFVKKIAGHIERFKSNLPDGTKLNPKRKPFPSEHFEFLNDEEFNPPIVGRFTVRKWIDDIPFEFFMDMKPETKKLVIFGQDAVTREKINLPYFFRWKWSHRINASVIILNDPTLYLDDSLDGAWWIGSSTRDYISDAVSLIETVMRKLGIPSKDVLFVGMSAGGFSAMQMATVLKGSSALVDIPRVTLRAAGAKGITANQAVKKCLGFESAHKVPKDMLYRIEVIERIKKNRNLPKFYYFQNLYDEKHVESQYRLFRRQVESYLGSSLNNKGSLANNDSYKFIEYKQWNLTKGGHFPLKEAVVVRILNELLADSLDLPACLTNQYITRD